MLVLSILVSSHYILSTVLISLMDLCKYKHIQTFMYAQETIKLSI